MSGDGGSTWIEHVLPACQAQAPPACETGPSLSAVSCPSPQRCIAVGADETILGSRDGGKTWVSQTPVTGGDTLDAVGCADLDHCVAVGGGGEAHILTTSDGGDSWSPADHLDLGDPQGVSCPRVIFCVAVGGTGGGFGFGRIGPVILMSHDGGKTWVDQTVDGNNQLTAVSCPVVNTCFAVGGMGSIEATLP